MPAETDYYSKCKELQREQEMMQIQEDYIKDESKNLKREEVRAKEEIKRIQSVPLVIGKASIFFRFPFMPFTQSFSITGQFLEMVDANTGIVASTSGQTHYVRILSTINRELLKPNSSVVSVPFFLLQIVFFLVSSPFLLLASITHTSFLASVSGRAPCGILPC